MPMTKAGKAVRLQNLNTLDGIKYFATYLYIYLLCTFKICITAKLMKVAEKIKYAIKKFRLGSRTIFTKISSTRIINGIKSGIINNAFKELLRFIEIALPKLKKNVAYLTSKDKRLLIQRYFLPKTIYQIS